MHRVFRSKLLVPVIEETVPRSRLLEGGRPRVLVAQAPAGAGKSVFLAQWVRAQGSGAVFYTMDEQDRDGAVFAAHLADGFARLWPEWRAPAEAAADPAALAVELVNEAAGRDPVVLVLDRLDAAFGQAYLADFLAVLLKYAPPGFTLAVGTRAPLPVEPAPGRATRVVTAADLAFMPEEAGAWLEGGGAADVVGRDWRDCQTAAEGYPLALALWRERGEGWRQALAGHLLAELPPQLAPEVGRALVDEWLGGRLSLATFAHQFAQGQPGAERLWGDALVVRNGLLLGDFGPMAGRLGALWEQARGSGNRTLVGNVALLQGELHYCLGEYAQAMEWYRQAFEAEPLLELVGTHSMVAILRDTGHIDEGEALGRRCVDARRSRGDLQALAYACGQLATVLTEQGRFDEAEEFYREAERIGLKLSGEPFYGTLAMAQRAVQCRIRGNAAEFRRLAEEAYAVARRRSPWLEAICGYILASTLFEWGEVAAGAQLLQEALAFLEPRSAKWQLHMIYAILARGRSSRGDTAGAREWFDRSLGLAAREGYVQYLQGMRAGTADLIIDALVRGVEVPFCQELLVRMGDRALEPLLDLVGRADPNARRAGLYPLARISGEQAVAAIRHLLYDADESVRDYAILAFRSLGQKPGEASAQVGALDRASGAAEAAAVAVAQPAAPALAVAVLGPVTVQVASQPVTGWRTVKARDLIAYLVLSGDRPVTRDQILEALWPDSDLEGAQALLHTTLYYLRRALKPAGEGLIAFAGGAYRLDRERVQTDVDHFHRLAAAGGESAWREAASLYRGELLEGLDYPWADAPRVRARTVYLDVLRHLANHLRGAGRPGEALDWLQRLVQADPLAEDGHVALMECYAAIGNRNAALQQYRTLAHMLDEELGLEPGESAQALYRRILG